MGYSSHKWIWLAAFAIVVSGTFLGCGDEDGELAPELFGTWDLISLEAEGMSTDCPGEIVLSETDSVSCGTQFTIFNPDGTLVGIETTDELGEPYFCHRGGHARKAIARICDGRGQRPLARRYPVNRSRSSVSSGGVG